MGRQLGAFALVIFLFAVTVQASETPEKVFGYQGACSRDVADAAAGAGAWVRPEAVVLPDQYVLPSRSRSDRSENMGKLFQLKGHPRGLLLNGKYFPELDVHVLPKVGVPVAIASPAHAAPRARLYLLHGLGYSISTVFSVVQTAITLQRIADGGEGHPFAHWFAQRYPELRLPVETVIYDVPPMGWAPPFAELPTGEAMALYFQSIAAELQERSPLDDFYLCRSASCAPGLIAAETAKGAVLTGATFPNPDVLEANRQAVLALELSGKEKPLWGIIDDLIARFNEPHFVQRVERAARASIPVLSLVGGDDPETPEHAQMLWADLLGVGRDNPSRAQYVIPGAGHQVFRRPEGLPKDQFDESDPDVQAFVHLLRFLKAQTER